MPVNPQQLDAFLQNFPTTDPSVELQLLNQVKTQLLAGILAGETLVAIEIRQRRAQFPNPVDLLEYIDKRIAALTPLTNKGVSPTRNQASLRIG